MNYTNKSTGETVKAKRVSDVVTITNVPSRINGSVRVKFNDGTHDDMDSNACFIRSPMHLVPIVAGCWFVDGEGYMTEVAFTFRFDRAADELFKASPSNRYVSHKEVEAYEISRFRVVPRGYGIHFVCGQSRFVADEVFNRYRPQTGDFLVIYADGYVSVSPRSAFLEGYTAKPEPMAPADPVGRAGALEKELLDMMPGNRWGSIARTELEKAFMCVRRALFN